MDLSELLDRLGYVDSPNFLRQGSGEFERAVGYGHLLRRAARGPCGLQGVYALRDNGSFSVPLVYVCEADSDEAAQEVHKLVWNQDVVPFLIVNSPTTVRVYPGFCRRLGSRREGPVEEILEAFEAADNIARIAKTLEATAVDTGRTWAKWGQHIRPEYKVDWRLLDSLKQLDAWLQGEGELSSKSSHALIGKYVYLHYLGDRKILSPGKLDGWQIPRGTVFGREATVEGLRAVLAKLKEWLNGEAFPIEFGCPGAPGDRHVARVAATFAGAKPLGGGQWQLHLDFDAYDFSYIPIEVLSAIYEQFLHSPAPGKGKSRGKAAGAYYTPIPVVNFMLSELEEHRPLTRGMRVLDPACGSGAFLVQAFRRLIEKEFPPNGPQPSPVELRELLQRHFFGLDTDGDACGVAELSLILTLLDYVHPPDLENGRPGPNPKLPALRGKNIFKGNFFDDDSEWQHVLARKRFDWVVGNPPWKQLKSGKIEEEDKPVLKWMQDNEDEWPVGNRQMARAFAWRAAEYAADDGEVALFLPAMSLFESAAKGFRAKFFHRMQVRSIANFANLAEVISARRFRVPAAAFFYRPRGPDEAPSEDEAIRTYSPLVANQEATRPVEQGRRNETWTIVINASEVTDIPLARAANGSGLPWKLAAWGSHLDARLLRKLQGRFESLGQVEQSGLLLISEGLQLRRPGGPKKTEPVALPSNAKTLEMDSLKGLRDFFVFPPDAICGVDPELRHARKGRGKLPLSVCQPPHVIVSAARNFAVYSEEFLVVPPRQIGIISPSGDREFLKALALFLSSDFAFYHQFLASTQFGVQRGRATLRALREMPVPLPCLTVGEIAAWAHLHDRLVAATQDAYARRSLFANGPGALGADVRNVLTCEQVSEINALTYEALRLHPEDCALVHDLVRVRLELNDGKLGHEAVRPPTNGQLRDYGVRLRSELDAFVEGELRKRHEVKIIYDDLSGMVRVTLSGGNARTRPLSVSRADAPEAKALETCRKRLRRQRSQWVYFDRNFRVYDGRRTYVLKPMQRFHWTETQARIDAREIVAESMAKGDRT